MVFKPYNLFSQADVEIHTVLQPSESQGFLHWNTSDSTGSVDDYLIEIYHNDGTFDSLDLKPVKAYVTTNDYFRISNYFIDTNYFYKIIARNGNTEVGEEGPISACPGCYASLICEETCVGADLLSNEGYAWRLQIFINHSPIMPNSIDISTGRRQLGQNYSESYYMFYNQNWYSNASLSDQQRATWIHNTATNNDCYRMPNGNKITGNVYRVAMGLGPWSSATNYSRSLMSPQYHCDLFASGSQRRTHLMNLVNSSSGQGSPISPTLDCNPYPYCGPTGGNGPNEDNGGWNGAVSGISNAEIKGKIYWVEVGANFEDNEGEWDPIDNNHIKLSSANDILKPACEVFAGIERPEEDTISELPYISDMINMIINPISSGNGDFQDPIMLYPEDLFDQDWEFDSVDINLESGFYELIVNFDDASNVTYYFLFEKEGVEAAPLSNYINLKAYPVPVFNQNFSVEITSNFGQPLDFDYKLLDLNGVILDSQQELSVDGDKETITSNFPLSYNNQYLVVKVILSDNSTKEILIYVN